MNPKPRLLIIQQAPDWGGAEEWMTSVVRHLRARNIPITAYSNYPPLKNAWRATGARVHHLPVILDIFGNLRGLIKSTLLLPYALAIYIRLAHRAKQAGVNCVLMCGLTEKLVFTWVAARFKLPVIWYEYGPLHRVFQRNFGIPKLAYRLTKHLPSRIITISKYTQKSLITDGHVSPGTIRLIYPGVSLPAKSHPTSKPIVGHLSRLAPEKGQRLLLKAWPQVLKSIPTAKLHIAGRGPDESYLHDLVKQLKIEDSVTFHGFITNKPAFYNQLSLFVFPSVWEMEGFGLVAAEAMSHGLPVVGFQSGPVPEVVTPRTGQLVKKHSARALAQASIKLLQRPKKRIELGQTGYKRVKEKFNLTPQLDALYQQILDVIAKSS